MYSAAGLIIRLGGVPMIDASGERALVTIAEDCRKHGVKLMLTGLQRQLENVLSQTGLLARIGPENTFERTGPALDAAIANMDREICRRCPFTPFRECAALKEEDKTVNVVRGS